MHPGQSSEPFQVDLNERTKSAESPIAEMNRRLFMQLLVFDAFSGTEPEVLMKSLSDALKAEKTAHVIYADVNAPMGFALLTYSEDPLLFVEQVRRAVQDSISANAEQRPGFTMVGRTYSTGYESDLVHWLIDRPKDTVQNKSWPWAVWYPLRRKGEFERLEGREKGSILREHGEIGKAYGQQDYAHDVRLACHGIDSDDNEFVIGLLGKDLHPLSHVVQRMRSTVQTSTYMEKMGPFFVGYQKITYAP